MDYVLFHDLCPDGYTAAWAAWLKLENRAQYIPVQYGQPPPKMDPGGRVYILDFSYPRATTEALQARHGVNNVVVLDHHKTAEAELAGLPGPITFDMERSGAALAWEHFHSGRPAPLLVQYVQDRDLWQWRLPKSKEINAYLKAVGFGDVGVFHQWTGFHSALMQDIATIAAKGAAVLRSHDQLVALQAANARQDTLDEYACVIVNTAALGSETADYLLREYPDADVAMIWFELGNGDVKVSLRSRPGGPDVAELARAYGGGGHANAAGYIAPYQRPGFTPPRPRFP